MEYGTVGGLGTGALARARQKRVALSRSISLTAGRRRRRAGDTEMLWENPVRPGSK